MKYDATIEVELEDTPSAGKHEVGIYIQPAEPDVGIMSAFVECWELIEPVEITDEEGDEIDRQVTNWWESR